MKHSPLNSLRVNLLNTIRGIKNLLKWLPTIWNDRDWDNYYIENILYHKLHNTLNFFQSKNSVTDWDVPEQKKSLQALKICITILERRRSDFYIGILDEDNFSLEQSTKAYKLEERDQMILGKLIGKYLNYWWD